jgi:hypothetical protein
LSRIANVTLDLFVAFVMTWVGRELAGLTGQELAKELHQDPAVFSRGLGKVAEELASKPELRGVVENALRQLEEGKAD